MVLSGNQFYWLCNDKKEILNKLSIHWKGETFLYFLLKRINA